MPVMETGTPPSSLKSTREIVRPFAAPVLDPVFPLLLALADDALAAPAIRVTSALARSRGAVPTVLRALGADTGTEVVLSPFVGFVAEESLSSEYRDECRDALQKRVASVAGNVRWRFEVADQPAVEAVIDLARQLNPGLIVMGLRHHSALHRAVSRDMLRAVVKATRMPVLAVRPELLGLPQRIVVGIDFSEGSVHAAKLARHLLADDGEMYLLYVAADSSDSVSRRNSQRRGHGSEPVRAELERVIESLSLAPEMKITPLVASGDIQLSIEGCAQRVGADLLAVGSDHHSPLSRLFAGSVSMGLAHSARWSTLVVPSRSDD